MQKAGEVILSNWNVVDDDKQIVPYDHLFAEEQKISMEIAKYNEEFEELQDNSSFVELKKDEIDSARRKVELLVSQMIDLARFPDFRATQIADQFNEVMHKFDSFDDVDKRCTVYFLLDFMNHVLLDGEDE